MRENPDNNTITATFELPGLRREDVDIELHNNLLTISGERSSYTETKPSRQAEANTSETALTTTSDAQKQVTTTTTGGTSTQPWIVRERSYGRFTRSIPVPEGTQPESIKASVVDGILTIAFPKRSPGSEPKKIEISRL